MCSQVCAVRVDDHSRREISALFKCQALASPQGKLENAKRVKGLNEEVFVTQLVVSAEAVDLEFQEKIENILRTHAMSVTYHNTHKVTMKCRFAGGVVGDVEFHTGPIKVCLCIGFRLSLLVSVSRSVALSAHLYNKIIKNNQRHAHDSC